MKKGQSLKQRHKHERQESLRELLSKQGHLQKVIDNVKKLEDLEQEIDRDSSNRLKICIETRLKLINKYLPDLKAVEISNQDEERIIKQIEIKYVKADDSDE